MLVIFMTFHSLEFCATIWEHNILSNGGQNGGSVIYILLLMIRKLWYILDKYLNLPFGRIWCLRFHCWSCVSLIYILLIIIQSLWSLLHKGFMTTIFSHVKNSGSVTIILIFVIPKRFSMIPRKYICYAFSTHNNLYI